MAKLMKRAKVILKGAKSYTLAGAKYIKDVPKIVKGEAAIEEFMNNGYFVVTHLESKVVKKKKKKLKEPSSPSKKKVKKKASKKTSSSKKKVTKKKVKKKNR